MAFFEGLFWGLGLMFLVGPVFFTLLQATLHFGFKAGWAVAFGIVVSDIVCVILCRIGVEVFLKDSKNVLYLGAITFCLLLGMGLYYAFAKNIVKTTDVTLSATDYLGYFIKGFLVNFVNPFVFFVWTGICSYAVHHFEGSLSYWYLAGVLIAIFGTDTLKAAFANKLKSLLDVHKLGYIYKGVGILLIIFAFVVLYRLQPYFS